MDSATRWAGFVAVPLWQQQLRAIDLRQTPIGAAAPLQNLLALTPTVPLSHCSAPVMSFFQLLSLNWSMEHAAAMGKAAASPGSSFGAL